MSPCAGAWTPLPHDARIGGGGLAWTADANFEAGYYLAQTAGGGTSIPYPTQLGHSPTLGIGDTIYLTQELGFGATTWAPGANEDLVLLGGAGVLPRMGISRASTGTVTAFCYDANAAVHRTPTWTPSASTHYALGVSVKRNPSGANTVVDIVLYDVDGTTNGGTPIALATLTADVISGADKTLVFGRTLSPGMQTGFAKAGTGQMQIGVTKVNVSSAVVLSPTGSAWTQAAVDQVHSSLVVATDTTFVSAATVIGLITVYDTSASGDGWPTVWNGSTGCRIDWRLPTSDQTPLQFTAVGSATHYENVDDAFGSYDANDYNYGPAHTQNYEEQYGYGALSLSGKTVLTVGLCSRGSGSLINCALNVNGTLTGYITSAALAYMFVGFWDKVTVGAGFPAATPVARPRRIMQAVNRASSY